MTQRISTGKGRPRDPARSQSIMIEALREFADRGYGGFSLESVATRAGVAKTTVYRRWDSKDDLIIDAVSSLILSVEAPDTGSLRDDLVAFLLAMQRAMATSLAGAVFPRIVAEIANGSSLGTTYRERVLEPRLAALSTILQRGIIRGELDQDADIEFLRFALLGPVVVWKLLGWKPRGTARQRAERLVAMVLDGEEN